MHLIINRAFCCLQSYIHRSRYILSVEEREKWQQVDNRFMSDKSSNEEGVLSVHHHTWRSSGEQLELICTASIPIILACIPYYDILTFIFLQN